MKNSEKNITFDFILGVLVGIYGNLLASLPNRMSIPILFDWIFYLYFFLTLGAFLTFPAYLASAFMKKFRPTLLLVIHCVLLTVPFLIKHSFYSTGITSVIDDTIFLVFNVALLSLVFMFEWVGSGRGHQYSLNKRWKKPIVGILSDMGENMIDDVCTYTEKTPEDWKQRFNMASEIKAELITLDKSLDSYVAILNPYGGVYPESDLTNLSGVKTILNYVKDGGIFVNIADIPCYWAYNKNIKRKVDTTPPSFTETHNIRRIVRDYALTPLLKELGLVVSNASTPLAEDFTQYMNNVTIQSKRVALVESNMITYIPNNQQYHRDVSSFFSIPYGSGDFLFSLIFLNSPEHNQQAKETIRNAIVTCTTQLISKKRICFQNDFVVQSPSKKVFEFEFKSRTCLFSLLLLFFLF